MTRKLTKYGKWALVVGGSTGIGRAFAEQIAASGMDIVLVARGKPELEKTAESIIEQYNVRVETIAIDMVSLDAPQELFDKTADKDIGLLVLSAGMETTGDFTIVDLKFHRNLIQLNIQVPAELSRLFGQKMADQGRGGIIFLSSLFGYQGVPLVANYAASKSYILTLGEALNVELKPHGVDVLVVSPGLTETAMSANMPVNFGKMPITKHQPDKVARIGLWALGRKASIVPGLMNKIYAFENRFIPRLWPTMLFGFLLRNAMKPEHKASLLRQPAKKDA